eukprot:TRINITY_DN9412_c0_g1_i5.p2 TRINITY_DN9412_c0_g1~~TRINITY_DN9412_c0_g1_i5.p2  ORF type:complete len:103 (-),score=29.36 TRINITY_DN9412_c0_g1_i5:117-425(-)
MHTNDFQKLDLNYWAVAIEPLGYVHHPMMGWSLVSSSEDPFDKFNPEYTYIPTCGMAIETLARNGFGFSITYPRHTPYKKKWYADNFNWAGPPEPKEDEEDF